MIARVWHGRTKVEDHEVYTSFMKETAVPYYQNTEGFVKLTFLRKREKGIAQMITYWKNLKVIKSFAREDFEKGKYYPEDGEYLLEFEEKVIHHEMFVDEG